MKTIGIDLGGHKISAASVLLGAEPAILEQVNVPTPSGRRVEDVADQLTEVIAALSDRQDVKSVGIGLPGFINKDRKRIDKLTNFPILETLDFVELMEGRLRKAGKEMQVSIENDANCFALGEGLCGAAKGIADFVVLTLGTGIGTGIVSNGRLLCGAHGLAGESGHIPAFGDLPCNCGGVSHVETYAGADGVEREARKLGLPEDFKEIWLHRGEKRNAPVVQDMLDALARGVAATIVTLDPELVILSGGMSRAAGITEALHQRILPYLPIPFRPHLNLVCSRLGERAALYGAATLSLQK